MKEYTHINMAVEIVFAEECMLDECLKKYLRLKGGKKQKKMTLNLTDEDTIYLQFSFVRCKDMHTELYSF